MTAYHSKYFAHELTKRCSSDSLEKLAGAVASAQVDLNPHQVDAALFAFNSPLSKGALLADEVGLGKTIEAGLVLSRHILVITPSNLRKQWHQELTEKFFLPCRILETRSYNEAINRGNVQPFRATDSITICSYQFARTKAADVASTSWDLVVIDEAHRLRNVYKPSNVIANALKTALHERHKLLLTATPLQNSLLELFGLVSIIDDHAFGDLNSRLAVILDRDSLKWFRPARGQFLIFYKWGAEQPEYQPDFVAETESSICMIETKAKNEMDDPEVRAKRDAAVTWCERATIYADSYKGKPWKYLLIPHDAIADNMTLARLEQEFFVIADM